MIPRVICRDCIDAATAYVDDHMGKLRQENESQRGRVIELERRNAHLKQAVEGGTLVATRLAENNTDLAARLETATLRIGEIAAEARPYAGFYPEGSDGRNTFIIFAAAREDKNV